MSRAAARVPAVLAGQVDLPPELLDVVPGVFGQVDRHVLALASGQLLVDEHRRPHRGLVRSGHGNPRQWEEGRGPADAPRCAAHRQAQANQWEERWLSATDRKGRANFEKVAQGISAKFPDKKPVRIIPVGEVMYRLHLRMKEGKVPGFKHIADLYEDGVHLKSEGKYLEAVTHYATVFQEDPHGVITSGLRFWKARYSVDQKFAESVWDVVSEVVTTYSAAGVKGSKP